MSLSRLFQVSMQRLAKLNARQLTRLYCFCILKQWPRVIFSDSVKIDANFSQHCPYTVRYINVKSLLTVVSLHDIPYYLECLFIMHHVREIVLELAGNDILTWQGPDAQCNNGWQPQPLIGPIPWGHSGPLCHALSLSLALSWTSVRRRRATVPLATSGEWAWGSSQWWMAQHFLDASC